MHPKYEPEDIENFKQAVKDAEKAIDSLFSTIIVKSEKTLDNRIEQCYTIIQSTDNWGKENLK